MLSGSAKKREGYEANHNGILEEESMTLDISQTLDLNNVAPKPSHAIWC